MTTTYPVHPATTPTPPPPPPPTPPSGDFDAEWRDTTRHSGDKSPLAGRGWGRRGNRFAFAGLLVSTALLYLIGLSKSGWANQFYAAAAQSGSKSWKAFLFGSLDSSNFITVDKPPASLWVMDISVKLFGTNSWAILVPQALEGVAAVALLYAAVRRVAGPNAGLLAGAVLATTPVATLMFRYDNPDALLVLLMTAAAYATVRAIEKAGARWLALAGALIGFAFLTKMLQGLLVVPAFAIAYLVAAPTPLRRRIGHLLLSGLAMILAAGWWIALVELWPAGSRPFIGGSTDNSVLQLIFGYNGVGRLTGSDNNGNVSGGTGGFSSGQTGWTRLFGSEMGSQISWLLPAALVALAALGWLTARRARTDALRASVIVWGGWLLVTGVVLSFASGIIHPYYTVALAPAIAAVVGIGVSVLWRDRQVEASRWLLAAVVAAGAWWSFELLGRVAWHPELRWVVALAGAGAVGAVIVGHRVSALLVAPLVAVTLLVAPTAYALQTASTAHTGALPTAGPSATGGFGGPGGGAGGAGRTGGTGPGGTGGTAGRGGFGGPGTTTGGTTTGGTTTGGTTTGGAGTAPTTGGGTRPGGGGAGGAGGGQGAGGLGGATTVNSALTTALKANAGNYEWVAATTGDNEAASLELATGESVMALGGYNGTDPSISLSAFEKLVAAGKIHYYIADSQGFIGSTAASTSTAYQIQQWVTSHYTATTVGGTTVYNLS
jgi:4-amino-4-deoxy-L-arabinose transferase-like glycosyltransferase